MNCLLLCLQLTFTAVSFLKLSHPPSRAGEVVDWQGAEEL